MQVFLTGADGFIGSHLTETLVSRGVSVRAFVQYNSANSWGWLDHFANQTPQNLEIVSGDIQDPHAVKSAMVGCTHVAHLAALVAIPYSYMAPTSYINTNVKGTLNVLQAALDIGIERFVHTSTSEVYGSAQYVPMDEAHPLVGQSPYSASKIAADQMVNAFNSSFGLPTLILRPFNTFGPRQSARAVIPTVITQIAFGDGNVKLGALHPTRDFTYISDTVEGFCKALACSDVIGETINLGTKSEIVIKQIVHSVAKIMGKEVNIVTDDQRKRPEKSEVDRLLSDNSKAKDLIGWSPLYTDLDGFERGLEQTIDWFVNQNKMVDYKVNNYNV